MQALIRRVGYFALDRIRGSRVTKHLRDLDSFVNGSEDYRQELTRTRLQSLLRHAVETVPFYQEFKRESLQLEDFPIIRKSLISTQYDKFLSRAYDRGQLIPMTTSGSYGTPFTFWLTADKKARQTAEIIWFSRWIGYHVGDRHAYVRVTKMKSRRLLWLQNEVLMDPSHLSEEWMEAQRQALLKNNIPYLIGYPSAISALAAYCLQKGNDPEDFGVKGVITCGEPLSHESRVIIRRAFGAPVLSRYSSEETGVLAHESPACQTHHINTASYIIEFLKLDEDVPANPGELARVVVTDLFSHAMPLIRYEIGDLGILGSQPCTCGLPLPALVEIHGRAVEQVLDTKGERVSPFAINGAFRDLSKVQQFQFIQIDEGRYQVLVVPLPGFDEEPIIRSRLGDILGEEAEIELSLVDEIPALPSGKRPYILNRMSR